jgi:hypothetical protein
MHKNGNEGKNSRIPSYFGIPGKETIRIGKSALKRMKAFAFLSALELVLETPTRNGTKTINGTVIDKKTIG